MDDTAPIRVMALHALAYCERLFYLEEVEEIRVADERVYAGRTLHEELRRAEETDGGEWSSIELASERLGLVGKVDALRRRDGQTIPYEHKRGRPWREGKQTLAWPSDALQIAAYAMLLEEEDGVAVTEGRVRYHADSITVRVPVDAAARDAVRQAVNRARELRATTERPPVAANDRLCIRCSLAPVCLPEEERLAEQPDWEPVRLFPPDRELKTVHVVEPGAKVGRSGDTLKVEPRDGEKRTFPVREVGALVLHGYPQVTTQALHFCAANGIAVHWISAGGRYVCGLAADAPAVQRRIRQFQALSAPDMRLALARKLAMAKVEGALRYLLRATRGCHCRSAQENADFDVMRDCLKRMAHATSPDELRGHEGLAGRAYFNLLPGLLRSEVPDELRFAGRNRRPPKDRFNALLGFGYALLYQSVIEAILTVGLDPALGFFHTPRSASHPLVLDLMELFRTSVWDIALVGSLNRLQWNPATDFQVTGKRVWLSEEGRAKAIRLYQGRLDETWRHPVVDYSLSYARLIELEVRLLEKEWTGFPGLFAKMRLR